MTRAAEIIGFVGRKGSGKTYGGLQELKKHRHSIRVDLNGQPDMEQGAMLCPDVASLVHFAKNVDRRKSFSVLWRGERGMSPEQTLIWAGRFAVSVGCTLFSDETESQLPKHRGHVDELLQAIIMRGRHIGGVSKKGDKPSGVPFIWTGVNLANINPMLRNQCDRVHYFKGYDVNYQRQLADIFPPELIRDLAAAPDYSCLIMDAKKGPYLKENKNS